MSRHNPLTRKELYVALLPLVGIMEKFKKTGEGTLKPDEVQLMSDVYPSVQEQARGNMPLNLNVGCPACIKEAFHVFISVYDKLAKDPHVTEDVPPVDGLGKGDGLEALPPLTPEENELLEKYFDTLDIMDGERFLAKLIEASKDVNLSELIRAKVAAKLPEVQALIDEHNATHLNEGELAGLRILLGVTEDNSLQDFYVALADYVDTLDEPSVKLTNKLEELESVVNSLPPAPKAVADTSAYERRVAALLNIGCTAYEDEKGKGFVIGEIFFEDEDVRNETDAEFKETLQFAADELLKAADKPAPEASNIAPNANPAPEVIGKPINTPESQTPAQKAAATRARNKEKEAK